VHYTILTERDLAIFWAIFSKFPLVTLHTNENTFTVISIVTVTIVKIFLSMKIFKISAIYAEHSLPKEKKIGNICRT
jgi:hypothetical protein